MFKDVSTVLHIHTLTLQQFMQSNSYGNTCDVTATVRHDFNCAHLHYCVHMILVYCALAVDHCAQLTVLHILCAQAVLTRLLCTVH
jgi:hypothetical protein